MENILEIAYWMALSQLPGWRNERTNRLIIRIIHEEKISLCEFWSLSTNDWIKRFNLNEKEINDLQTAKQELPNYSFLAEDLLNQGYEIIPINSVEYSKTLKENLKVKHSPPLLYIKGNKKILQENSIAIVGSRDASEIAIKFTDNIARLASKEYKVIVSGFAKGVDKQALDSAIACKGQSIIVLPQGIMTFDTGFAKYYRQIIDGDVLVLSVFHPKVPWTTQLAMARNPIIYGLAKEIYVAESKEKGGTWSGVIDGLRKGRKIYVRASDDNEQNTNKLLIEKGAVPVDFNGISLEIGKDETEKIADLSYRKMIDSFDTIILKTLESEVLTVKEIKEKTGINLNSIKLSAYLKKISGIEVLEGKPLKFKLKQTLYDPSLFT